MIKTVLVDNLTKEQAYQYEDNIIRALKMNNLCINERRSGLIETNDKNAYMRRYYKQYYEDNKEQLIQCNKQWKENNSEYMKQYMKQYYENNKEKVRQQQRQQELDSPPHYQHPCPAGRNL